MRNYYNAILNNKLMLKFTAELSQEFRRASSLSSLKAYQISKSASKPVTWQNYYPPRPAINHHQPRNYDQLRVQNYHSYEHQRQQQLKRGRHYQRPIKTFCYDTSYASGCQQKTVNCSDNPHCNWSTPKRVECVNHYQTFSKPFTSKSTTADKFYRSNNVQKRPETAEIQTQFSLSQLNQNNIAVKNEKASKIRNTVNALYPQDSENDSTVKKASNVKERANHAAKMRISSINSLENIQKRIQATLGHQNQLKI